MNKLVIILGLMLGWGSIAHATAGDAGAGESKSAVCVACHGAGGNSMVPTFPKLAGQNEKYLSDQLLKIRDGGRPVPTMAGQLDNLSDQDLADIAAYFAAQSATGGQADPNLVELGAQIYRGGISGRSIPACSACHSPTGEGNGPAGFPRLAGQHADYTAAQLMMYRKGFDDESGRRTDGDAKIMRSVAFGLSDKEIEAVSSFIAGLN